MTYKQQFAERLRIIAAKENINRKQFAAAAGISPNTVGDYFNGKTTPPVEVARNICKAFGVSADWLLGVDSGRS